MGFVFVISTSYRRAITKKDTSGLTRCGVLTDTFHHCGILFTSSSLVFLGRPYAIKMETREVKERTITVQWTPAFDGGRPITSYSIRIKDKHGNYTKITHTIKVESGHLN